MLDLVRSGMSVNATMHNVHLDYDKEDRRRLRSGLIGRAPFTRSDAELIAQRFPFDGSRASKALVVLGPLVAIYSAVLVVLGLVHHHIAAGWLIFLIFVVLLGVCGLVQPLRVRRKIKRALDTPGT